MATPEHVRRLSILCDERNRPLTRFLREEAEVNPSTFYRDTLSLETRQRVLRAVRKFCPALSALWLFPPAEANYGPRKKDQSLPDWLTRECGLMPEEADFLRRHARGEESFLRVLLSRLAEEAQDLEHHLYVLPQDILCRPAKLQFSPASAELEVQPVGEETSILVNVYADLCLHLPPLLTHLAGSPLLKTGRELATAPAFRRANALQDDGFNQFFHIFELHRLRGDLLTCRVLVELLCRQAQENQSSELRDFAQLADCLLREEWSQVCRKAEAWAQQGPSYFTWLQAVALAWLSKWEEAEKLLQQVVDSPFAFGGFDADYWRLTAQLYLGIVQRARGRLEEAERTLVGGEKAATAAANQPRNFAMEKHYQALSLLAQYQRVRTLKNLGRLREAAGVLTQTLDQLPDAAPPALRGMLYSELADVYRQLDDWAKMEETLQKAIPLLKQAGVREELAKAYRRQAVLWRETGAWEEAEKEFFKVLRELGSTWPKPGHRTQQEGIAFSSLGILYTYQRRFEEAFQCFRECWQTFENALHDQALLYDRLGYLYFTQGELARAVALYQKSLETFRQLSPIGIGFREFQVRLHLAEAYVEQGRYQEAEQELAECEGICERMGHQPLRYAQIWAKRALRFYRLGQKKGAGEALGHARHFLEGRLEAPASAHKTALKVFTETGLLEGDLAFDEQQWETAVQDYAQALERASEFNETFARQNLDHVFRRLDEFLGQEYLRQDGRKKSQALEFCQLLRVQLQARRTQLQEEAERVVREAEETAQQLKKTAEILQRLETRVAEAQTNLEIGYPRL